MFLTSYNLNKNDVDFESIFVSIYMNLSKAKEDKNKKYYQIRIDSSAEV